MTSRFLKIAALFAGLFLGVLILEAAGRFFPDLLPERTQDALRLVGHHGIGKFTRDQASFFEGDPITGIHVKPNRNVWLQGHPDYSYRIVTHSLPGRPDIGIRDEIPPLESPCGIAVGDSYTFGVGVNGPQTWPKLLSRLLGCRVVDLGLPSACSTQYTLMAQRYGAPLHPKFILWEAYMPNILENDWFDLWSQSGGGTIYSWADWRDRFNNTSAGLRQKVFSWLMRHSVLFNLVKNKLRGADHEYRNGATDIVFGGPYRFDVRDPSVQNGLRLMEKAILSAKDTASKIGAALVIVYFPTKEEAYADVLRKMTPVKPIGLGEPDGALHEFANKHGIGYISLTPALRDDIRKNIQVYFRLDNHWNAAGHAAVAREIARNLRTGNLAPGGFRGRKAQESKTP